MKKTAFALVMKELDGGGAAVPVGLLEKRRAGQGRSKMQARYTLLQGFNAKGQMLLVIDDQVEAVKGADGRYGYVLTDEGIKAGLVRLQYVTDVYNDQRLLAFLGPVGLPESNAVGLRQAAHVLDAGVSPRVCCPAI